MSVLLLSCDDLDREESLEELLAELERVDVMERSHPELLGLAVGASAGSALSVGLLSTLGLPGLSAVGVTSGLSAAGAIVGGGMVSGLVVLSAPVAALAVAGWSWRANKKRARVRELQQRLLSELMRVQSDTLRALEERAQLSCEVISALEQQVRDLELLKRQLSLKLARAEGRA